MQVPVQVKTAKASGLRFFAFQPLLWKCFETEYLFFPKEATPVGYLTSYLKSGCFWKTKDVLYSVRSQYFLLQVLS